MLDHTNVAFNAGISTVVNVSCTLILASFDVDFTSNGGNQTVTCTCS